MSDILQRVHETIEGAALVEMTPPHEPRTETPEYERAHKFLVKTQDRPCEVCGVRNSTLHDPQQNPYKATAVESHHFPIERSLMDACDPVKVHKVFPQVYDQATLAAFVDSPANLKIICSIHHRSSELGIHHLLSQDYAVLPFLYDNYQIAASPKDEKAVEAADTAALAVVAELAAKTAEVAAATAEVAATVANGDTAPVQVTVKGLTVDVNPTDH